MGTIVLQNGLDHWDASFRKALISSGAVTQDAAAPLRESGFLHQQIHCWPKHLITATGVLIWILISDWA